MGHPGPLGLGISAVSMRSGESGNRLATVRKKLDALINWERRDRSAGMRVSLEPASDLVRSMGLSRLPFRCVHVTGSKGKGSVAALIAEGLRAAGFRVGRYGSPHVEALNERVVLDGKPIEDDLLADAIESALAARERAIADQTPASEASWFDLITAAGLDAMAASGVEWGVIEVGLGGRLDSTNVVSPELCVITQIELEHTQVLGPTLAHIAREKAGILKAGASFVCGLAAPDDVDVDAQRASAPSEGLESHLAQLSPAQVIAHAAESLGIEAHFVGSCTRTTISERNLTLARAALAALGDRGHRAVDGQLVGPQLLTAQRVSAARLPGRLEWRRRGSNTLLLDGAHVASSLRLVLGEFDEGPLGAEECASEVVLLSLGKDKDLRGMLGALADGAARKLVCTSIQSGIQVDAEELRSAAQSAGIEAVAIQEPEQALIHACELAGPSNRVLVTGSLYLVGAVRALTEEFRARAR
ncbi:MAG: dihydrofolate synthase/folylpolyglutamate synthase [Planctomycetota bacterium]